MKTLFVVTLMLSSVTFAKVYKVESKFQFGNDNYNSTIILEEGKKGIIKTITGQKGYRAEVLVTSAKSGNVEQLNVTYDIAKIENGKLMTLGNPQFIVVPGVEASIESGDIKSATPVMKVATVVTKQD